METTDRVVILLMVLVAVAISVSLFERANVRIESLEADRVRVGEMYSESVKDAIERVNVVIEKAFELEVKP